MYSQTNHIGGSNLPRESTTPIQEAHVARETFGSIDRWRGDCPLHLQSVHLWCDEEDKMLMEKKTYSGYRGVHTKNRSSLMATRTYA